MTRRNRESARDPNHDLSQVIEHEVQIASCVDLHRKIPFATAINSVLRESMRSAIKANDGEHGSNFMLPILVVTGINGKSSTHAMQIKPNPGQRNQGHLIDAHKLDNYMDTAPKNYTTKAGMQRSYTNRFIKRGVHNILPEEHIQTAGINFGLAHHHSEHIFAILASNNLDKIKNLYTDAQQQNIARSINIYIHGDHSPSDLDMLALILLKNYIVENFPSTTVGLLFTYDNHYKAATHDPKTTSSISEMTQ